MLAGIAGSAGCSWESELYKTYVDGDGVKKCEGLTAIVNADGKNISDQYPDALTYQICPVGFSCDKIEKQCFPSSGSGCLEDSECSQTGKFKLAGWLKGKCVLGVCEAIECDGSSGYSLSNDKCVAACKPPQIKCGNDGTCIDPRLDRNYCGATGTIDSCENPGTKCKAGTVCGIDKATSNIACTTECASGLTNCNGICINTGETHVATCTDTSDVLECVEGYANCDGNVSNGCEIQIHGTDNANCGACDKTCASGEVCAGGDCGTSCQAGLTNCKGTCVNTGETHIEACKEDSESTLTCVEGYADCDGNVANGCEVQVNG